MRASIKALRIVAVAAASFLVLSETAENAFAERYSVTFHGTRQQVRKACAAAGGAIAEGGNYSSCSNSANGGGVVTCDDKGVCSGTYTAARVNPGATTPARVPTMGLVLKP
jgi:hypothetical protein